MTANKVIERAKSLASSGQTNEAVTLLQQELTKLQQRGETDLDTAQMVEVEKTKGSLELSAGQILNGVEDYKEAVTHYLLASQALKSAQSMGNTDLEALADALNGTSECFASLGSEFEKDKYAREADEVRSTIFRQEIAQRLGDEGYKFKQEVKVPNVAQTVDFVGEKGSFFRKKRLYVWFAFDETECQHLSLSSRDIKGLKYFLLVRGNPALVIPKHGEKIIKSPEEIEP